MIYIYLAVSTTALLSTVYALQKTIFIANKKNLFDEPSEARKIHVKKTPNLGGVAIFSAFVFTLTMFSSFYLANKFDGALIAASIIIFFVGLTDDLSAISPLNKLGGQLVAAVLVCLFSDLRIKSLNGFMDVNELPYIISIGLTVLFIVFVINAYNLIDGINWLAGTMALLGTATYSILFFQLHDTEYFFACLALTSCLIAFLIFNKTPARIFMGDSGSLFLGFSLSVFSLRFLQNSDYHQAGSITWLSNSLMIVLSIIIIPVMDTARVFILRILRKQSPFAADKNHLHHILLAKGIGHLSATAIIVSSAIPVVILAIVSKMSIYSTLTLIVSLPIALIILMYQGLKKHPVSESPVKGSDEINSDGKLIMIQFHNRVKFHSKNETINSPSAHSDRHVKQDLDRFIKKSSLSESNL